MFLTLPVSRTNIVQSHYFFYLLIVVIGAVLSYGVFFVYSLDLMNRLTAYLILSLLERSSFSLPVQSFILFST